MSRPEWFAAIEGEQPYLWDELGHVRARVYLAESGETRLDAIAAAMRLAIEAQDVVAVYDASETFLGTAYGF